MEILKHIIGFVATLIYCSVYIYGVYYLISCGLGWKTFSYKRGFYILLLLSMSEPLMKDL